MDPERVKQEMLERMNHKHYDPETYYHTEGIAQKIAKSHAFDYITMLMIFLNTFYIGYDTQNNPEMNLVMAEWRFQVLANIFCSYFLFEITVRLFAFQEKANAFKDPWFVFDSSLVLMMIFETWLMPLLVLLFGDDMNLARRQSALSALRLVKFVRVARFTRLARIFPELMVLLKGMGHALGSVFFTLVLLFMLAYVFAIAFTLFVHDDYASFDPFKSVSQSMLTLIVRGTLLDEVSDLVQALTDDGLAYNAWYLVAMFLVYVLLSALTVLNLLIGVMCEAVSSVANVNREENKLMAVKAMVEKSVKPRLPADSDRLSREIFKQVLAEDDTASETFQELGVDMFALVDIADFLFQQDPAAGLASVTNENGATFTAVEREMELNEFVGLIMRLRSSNTATVKDLVETQKFFKHSMVLLGESLRKTMRTELSQVRQPHHVTPSASSSQGDGREEVLAQLAARAADLEHALAEAQRTFQDFARTAAAGQPPSPTVAAPDASDAKSPSTRRP